MLEQLVLCQACLKVLPYTDPRHQGIECCSCGGDLCGCGICTDLIEDLDNGKFPEDIKKWSRDGGVMG